MRATEPGPSSTASDTTAAKTSPSKRQVHKRHLVGVWCLPAEKAALEAHAAQTGLSVSAFLRTLGLGYEPRSLLDADTVRALAKVNGDQGRLGGLLKLYLTNDEKLLRAHDPQTLVGMIEALLERLDGAQTRLLLLVAELERAVPGAAPSTGRRR